MSNSYSHTVSLKRVFNFSLDRKSLMSYLVILIAVLSVFYMIEFGKNATIGYQLTRLESQRDKLLTVREQHNIDLSRSQSLEYIKQSGTVGRMIHVAEVEYLEPRANIALR